MADPVVVEEQALSLRRPLPKAPAGTEEEPGMVVDRATQTVMMDQRPVAVPGVFAADTSLPVEEEPGMSVDRANRTVTMEQQPVALPAEPERITAERPSAPVAVPKTSPNLAAQGLDWKVEEETPLSGLPRVKREAPAQEPAAEAKSSGPKMKYEDHLRSEAIKRGIDPEFAARLMRQESGGDDPTIQGPKTRYGRARGLMQMLPDLFQHYGGKRIYDPHDNIERGLDHLAVLAKKYDGDQVKIAAAYNAGEPSVDDYINGTNKSGNNPKQRKIDSGVPPFEQTQNYARIVGRPGQSAFYTVPKGTQALPPDTPPEPSAAPPQPAPPTAAPQTIQPRPEVAAAADPRAELKKERNRRAIKEQLGRHFNPVGIGEVGLDMMVDLFSSAPAAVAGMIAAIGTGDKEEYAKAFAKAKEDWTQYTHPHTEYGKQAAEAMGQVVEMFRKAGDFMAEGVLDPNTATYDIAQEIGGEPSRTPKAQLPTDALAAALFKAGPDLMLILPMLELGAKGKAEAKPKADTKPGAEPPAAPAAPKKTVAEEIAEIRPLKPKPVEVSPDVPGESVVSKDVPQQGRVELTETNGVPGATVLPDVEPTPPKVEPTQPGAVDPRAPPTLTDVVEPKPGVPIDTSAEPPPQAGRTEPTMGEPGEMGGRTEPTMGAEPQLPVTGRREPVTLDATDEGVPAKVPHPEPVVKRAADFKESGNYDVTIGNKKHTIYRDPENKWWYEDVPGKHFSETVLSTETQKDAIARLKERYAKENPSAADEPHPEAVPTERSPERVAQTAEQDALKVKKPGKGPEHLTNPEINKAREKLNKESEKLNDQLIAEGRGHELPTETLKKDDPLSKAWQENARKRDALNMEASVRMGPDYRGGPLPKGTARVKYDPGDQAFAHVTDLYERDHQLETRMERMSPTDAERWESMEGPGRVKTVQAVRRLEALVRDYKRKIGDNLKIDEFWETRGVPPEANRSDKKYTQEIHRLRRGIEKLLEDLQARREAKREKREADAMGTVRGPDRVREVLYRARRRGEITQEEATIALWLIDKNPNLANGLAISIQETARIGNAEVAGKYEPVERLITLSKSRSATDPAVVHEILHHTERMLPHALRENIRKEWAAAISKEMELAGKAGDTKRMRALEEIVKASDGDPIARKIVAELFRKGVLTADRDYHLVNPSEYWAVKGSDIMTRRFAASSGGWVAKAKQWYRELVEKLKSVLRLNSDAPIIRALDNLSGNEGVMRHPTMIHLGGGIFGAESASLAGKVKSAGERLREKSKEFAEDLKLAIAPMAQGSNRAMALAKDYANAERGAMQEWRSIDEKLLKNFTPEQRRAMGHALDEHSVLTQQGLPTAGRGLNALPADQRAVIDQLALYGQDLWEQGKEAGVLHPDAQQIPFYMPRFLVHKMGGGKYEHMGVGPEAVLIEDIRALPLALSRFERAIAGRRLVNSIRDLGRELGETLVKDATATGTNVRTSTVNLKHRKHLTPEETLAAAQARERPTGTDGFFTLNHPSFKQWRPEMVEKDGAWTPRLDEDGNIIFEEQNLRISNEFKGPLQAIMREPNSTPYNLLMALKGKAMSLIMYSPMIHNLVEYGRALPAMPGKVFFGRVYFQGNKARQNPALMRQATDEGMAPIGKRGFNQDITSIAEEPTLEPGRSITSQVIGGPVGLINEKAGTAVKRGIDKAGDIWHNTLLWDRIADLQMGLYVNFRESLKKRFLNKGLAQAAAESTAGRLAAHWANRFAGALPQEAMSSMLTKLSNFVLFSRTFTIGNIGVIKDIFTGVPRDIQAQIARDYGEVARAMAVSAGRKKALSTYMLDVAFLYAANTIAQDIFDVLVRYKKVDAVQRGYIERAHGLITRAQENPFEVLTSPFQDLESLTSGADNEPGKEGRLFYDTESNGQGIYLRNPTGKIGEEFRDWVGSPIEIFKRKEGTIAKPIMEAITNDKGFGRHVYDPTDTTTAGQARAVGNIVINLLNANTPADAIASIANYLTANNPKKSDLMKGLLPLAGITVSRGHPGGPESGVVANAKRSYEFRKEAAMPRIRKFIDDGDYSKAMDVMDDIRMPIDEQRMMLRGYREGPSPRTLREFDQYSTPEQQQKLQDIRK